MIEKTLSRADEAFQEGRTEKEVDAKLKSILLEMGMDTLDYVLVQAWPNSASPHHLPGSDLVKRGEPVLIDIGVSHAGYYSDITRQVSVGEPSDEYKKIFAIVRETQAKAVDAVKAGIPISEVDKAARETIEKTGLGKYFNSRTGHSLGLEVHEPPSVWGGNPLSMQSGMVFTIEPGIYLPGKFGVRIEDTIAVTDQGVDRLTSSDRDLIIIWKEKIMGENVIYEKDRPIGRITLNRPEKRNALNPAALNELIHCFSLSKENNDLCVVYGAAGKDFTIGADLKYGYQMMTDSDRADEAAEYLANF